MDNSSPQEQNIQLQSERPIKGSFAFWLLFGLVLIAVDQLTKFLAFRGRPGSKLGVWLHQYNFLNDRFAFSLPVPGFIMVVVYTLVLGGFVYYTVLKWKSFNRAQALAAILILAGGLSNIGERAVLGSVRDFIYLWGGILNLADIYIIAGIILLLVASEKFKVIEPI